MKKDAVANSCCGSVDCAAVAQSAQVRRLQWATIAWMLLECAVALGAAWQARSAALLAFGSDSLVELLSAAVVLLQVTRSFRLDEETAARWAGALLFVLAGAVALSSLASLWLGVKPESSLAGIAITAAALVVMPLLSAAKRSLAAETGNLALAADSVQSATCAYLAAITLAGLAANAFFHLPWLDSVAALAAVPVLSIEGSRTLRGEGCCG